MSLLAVEIIASCDRRIEALIAQRAEAIEALLRDLSWMDIPVRRVRVYGSLDGRPVHILEAVDEASGRQYDIFHLVEACRDRRCGTLGARSRTSRRAHGCGTSFTYIGVHIVLAVDSAGIGYAVDPANLERRPGVENYANNASTVGDAGCLLEHEASGVVIGCSAH